MRKILFFTTLLLCNTCFSQIKLADEAKQLSEIEKKGFDAQHSLKNFSLASNNFDVTYYRCEWNIDPAVRYIRGSVISYFKILASTNNIVYDFTNELPVDSIIFRKHKIGFSQQSNKTLQINFQTLLSPNQKDSVSVFYHGVPPVSGDFTGGFVQTTHEDTPVIWTLSEPYNASDWWPCLNGLDDKADSIDVFITHPSKYKASGNGVLVSTATSGGNTISHYKHRYPIASYLVAFAVTNYSIYDVSVFTNGTFIPVTQYIYPEDLQTFKSRTYLMLNALKLFSNNLGIYPFYKERYGQTEFGFGGGMEHQTNSFVVSAGENLMVHELAHQWFGDKITCGSWQDIWLNEGFATWMADLFYTEKLDTAYYKAYVEGDLKDVVSKRGGSVFVEDTTSSNRIFDSRLTYHKGAFLLRMLRFTLGDSAFFKGINQYLTDPKLAYSFARTADLQRNLENASGKNLDYFFKQWFYKEGYPSFTVKWYQDDTGKLHFTVSETTSVPESVSFFKVLLPIQLNHGANTKTIKLQCNENNQTFIINDPGFTVSKIAIDPDKYLISKNNHSLNTMATPVPVELTNNIFVSPNPVINTATVLIKNLQGNTNLQLFNFNGNLLWSKTLDLNTQSTQIQIPFTSFISGTYKLVVTAQDGTKSTVTIVK